MIVDASVAVKWLIQEDGNSAALALLGRDDLAAPTLLLCEVANAVWKKQRRGELADDPELALLPQQLAELVRLEDETAVMSRALRLAIELGHPVYDCVYLALAEAEDTALVTADSKFLRKLSGRYSGATVVELGA